MLMGFPLVEKNSTSKVLKNPPRLLLGNILAGYACHQCADNFTTRAIYCYIRPGQVSCIKCTGWALKDKGKGISKRKGKPTSKAKLTSKVKLIKKLVEEELSYPIKRCRIEVLVPKQLVRDSIMQNKAIIQGIASGIQYWIVIAKGLHALLACSIAMWQAELESLKACLGPMILDMMMVNDSLQLEGSDMSESRDFIPNK
ncbi:hypothetical protein HETIRDRAFT_430429 [Heterobasidion irregulare TC 32-1]|uniref:Uncharacterized protein n=1 Tax=Heterobasidion irregulare (strain TC 32-1) TaxID=747525 RepID=W4JSZ8_HETIT|nr:uncharacterized protein HETIRDRAFT_430429 [Heterobasidion irregulare TC 32-1]ETW75991.1 hypothetical protein HETIRDRAFT_430429 [Heterobasidion irregulare TC 32-1]